MLKVDRQKRMNTLRAGFSLLLIGVLSGCATPALRSAHLNDWIRSASRSTLGGNDLSEYTIRYLSRRDLVKEARRYPMRVLTDLDLEVRADPNATLLFVLSELCYHQAEKTKSDKGQLALYLSSARYAYACLFDENSAARLHEFDPRFRLACDFYNFSIAGLIQGPLAGSPLVVEGQETLRIVNGAIEIHAPENSYIDLARLNEKSLAYSYEATAFSTQSRRYGVGVPLIAERAQEELMTGEKGVLRRRVPHITAATFFLRFDTKIGSERLEVAEVEIFDPVTTPQISIADRMVPLEADLSTPLAFLLEANRDLTGVSGMLASLKGDAISDRRGLYMMQPYAEGKIPVVFVHGLMSEPTTWLRMWNSLMFDPVLSERYQFWAFFYATSNPIIISAAELRESLIWTRDELDPDGSDEALDNMVIVGHSMGGLLTRLMTQRTDGGLAQSWANVPLEDLKLSDKERALLTSVDAFESLPFVDRVMFLAAPHKGADLATGFIGKIGIWISAAPKYVVDNVEGIMTQVGLNKVDLPTGIENLRSDSNFMDYYNNLPMDPRVQYHSIIGNRKSANIPGGSDGVVDYSSSHLDGAVSEKIVKSGHNVQNEPQTILEVRSILLEHLEGVDAAEASAVQ